MDVIMEKRLSAANDLREAERFGDSMKAYTECLVDLVDTNDIEGLIHCLGGQSLIYKNLLTKNNSAIYHYFVKSIAIEAYELAEANKDKLDGKTFGIALRVYGGALVSNGEYQEALPLFEKALAVSTVGIPEKGMLKANIGGLKYMLGDRSGGISTIESALSEIRSGDLDIYAVRVWETGALNTLAKIYAKEGNRDKAIELVNESLKIAVYHNLPIRKREAEQILQKINSGMVDFSL